MVLFGLGVPLAPGTHCKTINHKFASATITLVPYNELYELCSKKQKRSKPKQADCDLPRQINNHPD